MSDEKKPRAVLVTTAHRGVFFGFTTDDPKTALKSKIIEISQCRMIVHWSRDVRGVLGLAASGPTLGCRITKPCDAFLENVTGIFVCTPESITNFGRSPWQD